MARVPISSVDAVGKVVEGVGSDSNCGFDYCVILLSGNVFLTINHDGLLSEEETRRVMTYDDGLDPDMQLKLGMIDQAEHAELLQRFRDESEQLRLATERDDFERAQEIVNRYKAKFGG